MCNALDQVKAFALYAAMDWLLKRQRRIETKLARRHLPPRAEAPVLRRSTPPKRLRRLDAAKGDATAGEGLKDGTPLLAEERKRKRKELLSATEKELAESLRDSVVAPAKRSARAARKAARKRTDDGEPVHSFQTLLKDLATVNKNRVRLAVRASSSTSSPPRPRLNAAPLSSWGFVRRCSQKRRKRFPRNLKPRRGLCPQGPGNFGLVRYEKDEAPGRPSRTRPLKAPAGR